MTLPSGDTAAAILNAENQRCSAMLSHDLVALDKLIDPRLVFSHATGQIDDKTGYLAKMASGRIDYLAIDWSEQCVISLAAGAALLTGRMTSRVRVEGTDKLLDNRVLSAWVLGSDGWRVTAFQSTPLRV